MKYLHSLFDCCFIHSLKKTRRIKQEVFLVFIQCTREVLRSVLPLGLLGILVVMIRWVYNSTCIGFLYCDLRRQNSHDSGIVPHIVVNCLGYTMTLNGFTACTFIHAAMIKRKQSLHCNLDYSW